MYRVPHIFVICIISCHLLKSYNLGANEILLAFDLIQGTRNFMRQHAYRVHVSWLAATKNS